MSELESLASKYAKPLQELLEEASRHGSDPMLWRLLEELAAVLASKVQQDDTLQARSLAPLGSW